LKKYCNYFESKTIFKPPSTKLLSCEGKIVVNHGSKSRTFVIDILFTCFYKNRTLAFAIAETVDALTKL